jgi:hypothetical protein
MLPTVLNLTQLEVGIRGVVKKVLGLDAVVFPQSSDYKDKDKDRMGDAFGILCFHKGRTKTKLLHILEKAHSRGKFNRYFIWAFSDQCDEVEWILRNLSEDLRGRVFARYILGDLRNQPRAFIVALDDRVKDVEKGEVLSDSRGRGTSQMYKDQRSSRSTVVPVTSGSRGSF